MNEKIINNISERNSEIMLPQLFTDEEAAEYLKVSRMSLWRLRKAGELSFVRVTSRIMYRRSDLENFIQRHSQTAVR